MRSLLIRAGALVALMALTACPRPGGGQVRVETTETSGGEKPRFTPKQDPAADQALANAKAAAQGRVEAYLAVRKTSPESTAAQEALYQAGVLYFESGNYASARQSFNELLFENPLF